MAWTTHIRSRSVDAVMCSRLLDAASHAVHDDVGKPFTFPLTGPASRRQDSALHCTPLGIACLRPRNAIQQPGGVLLTASQRLVALSRRRISSSSIMRCRTMRVDAPPSAGFQTAFHDGTPLGGALHCVANVAPVAVHWLGLAANWSLHVGSIVEMRPEGLLRFCNLGRRIYFTG